MRKQKKDRTRHPQSAVAHCILSECKDSTRLLELFYWSREPGLLEIMRAIATMSEDARTALEVFVAMSHEASAIVAKWDASGRLTLTSPQAGQAVAVIQYCAEHDDVEKPLLPN
jgi:hypothetical protein